MKKELSERKQKILQAVVDEYITTAEPVSSGEIKEKYLADISSATIRNELASLEEMGYLVQPHVSAGRVPLPQAYKLYVDKVMNGKSLSKNEISFIKDKFSERMDRVEDIIEKTESHFRRHELYVRRRREKLQGREGERNQACPHR